MRSDLIGTADTNLSFFCVRWVHTTHALKVFLILVKPAPKTSKYVASRSVAVVEENRSDRVVAPPEMNKKFLDTWLFLLLDCYVPLELCIF